LDAPGIAEAVVRVDGLSKSYGRVRALDDVAFTVCTGEILGLIGPNGAGKTTLFECVAGLEAADRGDVFLAPFRSMCSAAPPSFFMFRTASCHGETSRSAGCSSTALGFLGAEGRSISKWPPTSRWRR
jgi:energy-coupling factor transporter ATP-binding protein EcfA2